MLPTKIPRNLLHYLVTHDLNTFPWIVEVSLTRMGAREDPHKEGSTRPVRLNIAFQRPIDNLGQLAAFLNELAELAPEKARFSKQNMLGRKWATAVLETKHIEKRRKAYELLETEDCTIKVLRLIRPPATRKWDGVSDEIDKIFGQVLAKKHSAALVQSSKGMSPGSMRSAVRRVAEKRGRDVFMAWLGDDVWLLSAAPKLTTREKGNPTWKPRLRKASDDKE